MKMSHTKPIKPVPLTTARLSYMLYQCDKDIDARLNKVSEQVEQTSYDIYSIREDFGKLLKRLDDLEFAIDEVDEILGELKDTPKKKIGE